MHPEVNPQECRVQMGQRTTGSIWEVQRAHHTRRSLSLLQCKQQNKHCGRRVTGEAWSGFLTQLHGSEWRVIGYALQRLSDVEWRYSQMEKEALALVWAHERFNMCVFSVDVELETDPKEYIYSQKLKPSVCVERWVICLQAYHFKVVYRPGKTLSRLNCGFQSNDGEDYEFVHAVVQNTCWNKKASAEDMELSLIRERVQTGDWSQCNVTAYLHIKNELFMYGELLLWGSRLVIPGELWLHVL